MNSSFDWPSDQHWADSSFIWFEILRYYVQELKCKKVFVSKAIQFEELRLVCKVFGENLNVSLVECESKADLVFLDEFSKVSSSHVIIFGKNFRRTHFNKLSDSSNLTIGGIGHINISAYIYFIESFSLNFFDDFLFIMNLPLERNTIDLNSLLTLLHVESRSLNDPEQNRHIKSVDLLLLDLLIYWAKKTPVNFQIILRRKCSWVLSFYRKRNSVL